MAAIIGSLRGSRDSTLNGAYPPNDPPTFSQEDPPSPSTHHSGRRGQKYSSVATTETAQSAHLGLRKRSCLQIMNDWWAWEVAGVLLSFMCLSAIVAILVRLDGKPLSVWNFLITPNAMISTFTTLSKVSLITALASCVSQLKWSYFQGRSRSLSHLQHFEDASRGPWGSLIFLWNMKAAAPLTSVGALLIILAMAIEPFAQQVIDFPLGYSPLTNTTAGISNVRYYGSGWNSGDSFNPGMVGAILDGIFGFDRPPQVDCPNGNCEFPAFQSLGVCSKCVNVTTTTKVSCQFPDTSMSSCNFLTPSGINVSLPADTDSITPYNDGGGIVRVAYTYTHMLLVPSGQLNMTAGIQSPLVGFAGLKFTATPVYLSPGPLAPYEINECAFYMCEKTYETARVTNGLASVEATPGKERQLHQTPWFSSHSIALSWRYLSFDAADDWEVVPPEYSSDGSGSIVGDPLAPPGRSFSYAMAGNEYIYLGDGLSTIFNITGTDNPDVGYRPFNLLASPLWNATDLGALFGNVSRSMTDYMRASSQNTTLATGTAYAQQTFVRVRWPWLVLQAVAIGVGIVVLLLTVVHTSRNRALVWKSSTLALLLHGIDAEHDGGVADVKAFRERWAQMAAQRNLSQMEMLSHDYVLRFEPGALNDGDGLGSGEWQGKFEGDIPRFVVQEKGTTEVPVGDIPL